MANHGCRPMDCFASRFVGSACAGMTGGLGVLRFPMSSVGAVAASGALSLCGGRSSMVQRKQRLHRSRDDRLLFGVAGGLAEFLDVDPVLVRVGWILLTLATVGIAVLAYIVLAVITPNGRQPASGEVGKVNDSSSDISDSVVEPGPAEEPSRRQLARNVLGGWADRGRHDRTAPEPGRV